MMPTRLDRGAELLVHCRRCLGAAGIVGVGLEDRGSTLRSSAMMGSWLIGVSSFRIFFGRPPPPPRRGRPGQGRSRRSRARGQVPRDPCGGGPDAAAASPASHSFRRAWLLGAGGRRAGLSGGRHGVDHGRRAGAQVIVVFCTEAPQRLAFSPLDLGGPQRAVGRREDRIAEAALHGTLDVAKVHGGIAEARP